MTRMCPGSDTYQPRFSGSAGGRGSGQDVELEQDPERRGDIAVAVELALGVRDARPGGAALVDLAVLDRGLGAAADLDLELAAALDGLALRAAALLDREVAAGAADGELGAAALLDPIALALVVGRGGGGEGGDERGGEDQVLHGA